MTKSLTKVAGAAIGLFVVVAIAAGLTFVYFGFYDVAATAPHFGVTHRLLRLVMEQSVKRQARDIKVPQLDDPEKVHTGFRNFHAMCVTCHGAPGAGASEISKGLYPVAPDLAKAVQAWTSAELFVIIKRGIKMSGMPAWEPTHSGDEIWAMVAFLKVLPGMPTAEYQAAVEFYEKNASGSGEEKHHGSGMAQ